MPESVTDRCSKAHEYLFLLVKQPKYKFNQLKELATYAGQSRGGSTNRYEQNAAGMDNKVYDVRNKRSVWSIGVNTFKGAHFATFPPDLVRPCVQAGSDIGDTVLDPFTGSGTTGVVSLNLSRSFVGAELNPEYAEIAKKRLRKVRKNLSDIKGD